MPARVLTAELRADISKFETSLDKAQTIVKGLDRTVSQTNNELKRFGNDFGGADLIRKANLAAKAVEDLGGVARLTSAEQKKLGTTVDQALEKYRALGQEVPPRLVGITSELGKIRAANEAAEKSAKEFAAVQTRAAKEAEDALKRPGAVTGPLAGGFQSLGLAVAGAFSVGSIVSFGKEIVSLGGEIKSLADRTGLTIEQVQTFQFAAEQTGASLDDVTAATEKLSDQLVSGDKGAAKAMERLGLSFQELRNLNPADAFTRVADAIGQVPDPMERTSLALDIFGKSGTKILPAITEGFSELTEKAKELGQVLSDDEVKALDEFGSRWDATMKQVKVAGAQAALGTVDAFKQSWTQILADQATALASQIDSFAKFKAALADPNKLVFASAAGLLASGARTKGEKKANEPEVDEADAQQMFRAAMARSGTAATEYTDKLKALRDEVANLTAAQKANIAAGDQVGDSNKDIAASVYASEAAVKLYLDRLKEAEQASKTGFTASLQKQAAAALNLAKDLQTLGGATKLDAQQRDAANKTLAEGVKAYELLGRSATPAAKQVHELFRATTDLKEPLRNDTNEIERLVGGLKKLNAPTLEPWFRLTTTLAGGPGGIAHGLSEGVERIVGALPKLTDPAKKFEQSIKAAKDEVKNAGDATTTWVSAVGGLSQAFSNLSQIGGDAFGGIAKQIGEVIALMGVGSQVGKQFRDSFYNPNKLSVDPKTGTSRVGGFDFSALGGGQGTAATISAYTNLATTAVAGYGALDQATNVKGRGNRVARGALTGASIGNSIVPGYGALVGAAVGALVGAFRNPAFEDVYNRVAKNFGVKLSDEAAKGIAKLAKSDFKGDRAAAEVASLDVIIGEGGGLKQSNIDLLTKRLRDAFSMKEVGKFSADQLEEVLKKNFGTFADFVGRSTTIAGKGFAEIAQLAKAAGADVESIKAFVGGQTARVGGGLAALAAPLAESAGLRDQAKAAEQAQIDAATRVEAARGGKADEDLGVGDRQAVAQAQAEQAKAAVDLAAINARLAVGTKDAQGEFDRLGIIAVGAFNAARASGLGYLEAVDQLSPGLDRMIGIQDQLGLSGNAAFSELIKFRDLVGTNETLVGSAEALNETILGLSNIGGLTADTLKALEGQGLATFDKLTAAGFSSGQAIEIQRGFIENLKLAHEQLGIPIDANTQHLIDQADALAGLKPQTTTDVMKLGFESVVTAVDRLTLALGGEVPAAAAAASAAIAGVATTAETEIAGRAGGAVIDLTDIVRDRVGSCVLTVDELRQRFGAIPDAATIAGAAVGTMSDDMVRHLDLQAKQSAEEFARTLGLAIPAAASEAGDAITTDLGDATRVWLEGSSQELKDFISKLRTTIPEAAAEAGRVIRDKIPRRIPVDVDINYNERGGGTASYEGGSTPADATPNAATGAIVFARPGGTRINVAEAGQAEVIAPLNRLAQILPGSAQGAAPVVVHVTGTIEGQPLLRFVARGLPNYVRTTVGRM